MIKPNVHFNVSYGYIPQTRTLRNYRPNALSWRLEQAIYINVQLGRHTTKSNIAVDTQQGATLTLHFHQGPRDTSQCIQKPSNARTGVLHSGSRAATKREATPPSSAPQ